MFSQLFEDLVFIPEGEILIFYCIVNKYIELLEVLN